MTLTQTCIDTYVVNAMCCSARLGEELIYLREIGDKAFENKQMVGMILDAYIFALEDLNYTDQECLTDDEILTIIQNMDAICSDCC